VLIEGGVVGYRLIGWEGFVEGLEGMDEEADVKEEIGESLAKSNTARLESLGSRTHGCQYRPSGWAA